MRAHSSVSRSCTLCPHRNQFTSSCSHPLSQSIIAELSAERNECSLFVDVRSSAMAELESELDRDR